MASVTCEVIVVDKHTSENCVGGISILMSLIYLSLFIGGIKATRRQYINIILALIPGEYLYIAYDQTSI